MGGDTTPPNAKEIPVPMAINLDGALDGASRYHHGQSHAEHSSYHLFVPPVVNRSQPLKLYPNLRMTPVLLKDDGARQRFSWLTGYDQL